MKLAELMEAAVAATGLKDFGGREFEAPLSVLIESYTTEAQLSAIGDQAVQGELISNLAARLRVVDGLKKAPQALEKSIAKPIFILGFPRTGTTTLHNLLQANSDYQVLEHWLAVSPMSRPPRSQWHNEPSYRQAAETLRRHYESNPDLRAQHDISVESADECRFIFGQMFMDDSFGYVTNLPTYRAWLDRQSMLPAYQWHNQVLKLLQYPHDIERRWVLKYPSHLAWLDALLEVYPDACIIHTHRDPVEAIPSFASLVSGVATVFSDNWTPKDIGRLMAEQWQNRVDSYLDLRKALDREHQFFDIQFSELLEDPVGAVSNAFEKFGLELSAGSIAAMRDWHAQHPPGRHGRHDYKAQDFGLEESDLAARFQRYREKFGLTGG